jgi:two-component system, NarL family, sensor histidine kinase UhpB
VPSLSWSVPQEQGSPSAPPEDRRFSLSTVAAGPAERKLALTVILVSMGVFAVCVPFAKIPLPPVWAFIPTYESALVLNDLITAVLLFGQFGLIGSPALLILAAAYVFTASITVVHGLTFPGLFAPVGLLGAGPQTTAWLYMFWHAGFPVFILAYAGFKRHSSVPGTAYHRQAVLGGIAAALALVIGCTLLATTGQAALPAIMQGHHYTPVMLGTVSTVWMLSFVALGVLWSRRPHTVLDLWLMVVLCAWVCDVALSAVLNAGRFDFGFYAGRAYGLLAASFVLIVLLLDTTRLYARLHERTLALHRLTGELVLAEQRERQRIAHVLHEGVQQVLVGAKLRSAVLDTHEDPGVQTASRDLRRLLDAALAEARALTADLSPPILEAGLVPALQGLKRRMQETYGLTVHLDAEVDTDLPLTNRENLLVYHAVRELLLNVTKHAHVPEARVSLARHDGHVQVVVADAGAGFVPSARPSSDGGFGLVSLRERLRYVGGHLDIVSAPGQGSRLTLTVPLSPAP